MGAGKSIQNSIQIWEISSLKFQLIHNRQTSLKQFEKCLQKKQENELGKKLLQKANSSYEFDKNEEKWENIVDSRDESH